ncbi:MAG: PAS domain S-box protein [Phycisphaerae bacterium]|nr:PAS domain S-box protein [Phycisphaerae bacterium]
MSKRKLTYPQVVKRLAEAEAVIEALRHHEVDAVVGEGKIAFLLVRDVAEALRKSEEAFHAMFELPGIGMAQADSPAFRFTRVNRALCEITGYSAGELLTSTDAHLTHHEDRRRAVAGFAPVIRGEADRWSIEKRYIRKDGGVIWVAINGAALRDEAGRVVRTVAMIEDITARKSRSELKASKRPGKRAG